MAGNEANLNKCIIYFYSWPKLLSKHFPISWVIPNFELLSLMNYSVRQKFDFVQIGPFIWPLAGIELNLFTRQEKSLFRYTTWGSMLAIGNYLKKLTQSRLRLIMLITNGGMFRYNVSKFCPLPDPCTPSLLWAEMSFWLKPLPPLWSHDRKITSYYFS